jgi:hypothetical protein
VDEAEFWSRLEFRICGEFAGFGDRALRHLWCDGLEPYEFHLDGAEPTITGRAYCGSTGQERWTFVLVLPPGTARTRKAIDWARLLPPVDVTQWLSPHPRVKRLVIDPHGAVPDELSTGSD